MNVFFDNCTSPIFAATLDAFVSVEGHRAYHIKDVPNLPRGRHSSDLEWIEHLRQHSAVWIFVSGDKRLRKNPAIRAALRASGLHGFVLERAYQKAPLNHVAAIILWKWPEMEQITTLLSPPSLHEIGIRRLTKLRQVPF